MTKQYNIMTLLALLASIMVTACQYKVPHDPYVLRRLLNSEPGTLNPITATDAYQTWINAFVYESLLERDNKTLDFKPLLAESWKISDDKLKITFKLRKNVRWHDGKPFTADDVIYTYKTIMDPKVASPHLKVYYQEIEDVEKLDEETVRFIFKRPYFLSLVFSGTTMQIIPKHIFDDGTDFNSHPAGRDPIGTGPYKFLHWKTGREVMLVRNENYWRKKPDIRGIMFKFIPDESVALQMLKKGELDLAELSTIQWVRQTGSEKFNKHFGKYQYYTPTYGFIAWNSKRPYFADKRVRRAMTYLTNRQEILEKISFGIGRVVTNTFYTNGPEYDHTIVPIPFDPNEAKKLLAEAGWIDHDGDGLRDKDGVSFRFEFMVPAGGMGEKLGTILKEDLKKAGIDLEIRKMEWAIFSKTSHDRTFDALIMAWVFDFEHDPYQVWHSSQAEKGSNLVGFKNPEADRLIETARMSFDRNKRVELYKKFSRIVDEEQPYTFLTTRPRLVVIDKRFTNVNVYPGGIDPLEWVVTVP